MEVYEMGSCKISTLIDGSLVFGREHEKKKIIDILLSDDCNNRKVTVICIVANSGIGKTTMVHLINNEESVSDAFDRRIYVSLSMNCDEKRLIKQIIESLSYSPCDITELKILEKILMDELMDKKFLLLLDGAEEGNKSLWDKLLMLLNVAANGSAILVTASRMEVADVTGATQCYQLECLSNEYCWQLFRNQTFFGHDPTVCANLVKIGEELDLVGKCGNNTLCVKMLTGLLRHSVTEEWWRVVLGSDLWDMFNLEEEMVLRVCYKFLPPHFKRCVAYCSLFPKNYIFSKHHLVRLWLSQGLIEPVDGNHDVQDIGFQYFDELCSRSYFQHSPLHDAKEDKFVMHELNLDFAEQFSRNEFCRYEDSSQILTKSAPHLSIVPFEYLNVSLNLITEARDSQSVLVINRYAFQDNITVSPILGVSGLNDIFVKSSILRTLDLCSSGIKELPDSIGLLRNLRFLGLNNTKIKGIPAEIGNLIYLLTLDAKGCNNLVELPKSIALLTSLQHLDVTKRAGFVCMPTGIKRLTNLLSLATFNVGCEEMHCGIGELKDLERLKESICISQLENVRGMSEAREANMKSKGYLKTLSLQWSNNIAYTDDNEDADLFQEEVLENLQPSHNLRELIIKNYAGNIFPVWIGDPSFSKLVSVVLDGCPNCSEFPSCGELPSLRYLSLQKFYGIERIESSKFPSLERLKLWEMYDLKDWVEIRDGDFPCLRSLSLKRCPLLRRVPQFPSLMELGILYCAQFSEIPDLPSLESLKIEGLQKVRHLNLPENLIILKKLEISRCSELLSLDGLSNITTLKKLKITQCAKLDVGNWRPNRLSECVADIRGLDSEKKEPDTCNQEICITKSPDAKKEESDTYNQEICIIEVLDAKKEESNIYNQEICMKEMNISQEKYQCSSSSSSQLVTNATSGSPEKQSLEVSKSSLEVDNLKTSNLSLPEATSGTRSEVVEPQTGTIDLKSMVRLLHDHLHDNEKSIVGFLGQRRVGKTTIRLNRAYNAFFGLEENWYSLNEVMIELQLLANIVASEIGKKLKGCDVQVQSWLIRVKEIPDKTLEDEYNKLMGCGFFFICTPDLSRYNLGMRIVKKLEHVNKLIEEGNMFKKLFDEVLLEPVEPKPQTKIVRMKTMLKQLHGGFDFTTLLLRRKVNSFFALKDNLCSLKEAKQALETVESLVTVEVTEIMNKLEECDPQVHLWLSLVKSVPDKALEDEYNKLHECGFFCNFNPYLPNRYRLGKRIIKMLEHVNKLIDEGKQFTTFGYTSPSPETMVPPEATPRTIGMEPMLRRLHECLNDKERSIIGVWGMGGVGKTTLLNAFTKDLTSNKGKRKIYLPNKSNEFDVVIGVDVSNSETLDVSGIQRMITEQLGFPWVDTETEIARAEMLMKALSGKRFMILLDNVWKAFRLEDVGIPAPIINSGCKIVLASRSEDVCIQMDAHQSMIHVQLLEDTDSWELFKANLSYDALITLGTNIAAEACAKAICAKCCGLPLALNVIGNAMATITSPNDWQEAMRHFCDYIVHCKGIEDEMFLRLKYSYDKLDKPTKECFLYCTLFPEHSSIKMEQLIEYWMAEGLIPPRYTYHGKRVIGKLLSVSLLQGTNSSFKVRLHDVIRHFGLRVANQESNFLVQSGQGLENPPRIDLWQNPKRISLMSNDIKDISFSPNCSNLETLLLHNNPNLKRLDPNFFRFMSNLRVLDLSNTAVIKLPKCDALVKLQYLNLSRTPIVYLPKRLWVLQELRHLDLSATKFLKDTFNNCSKLLKLRVLNLFRSNYSIRNVPDLNLDSLKELCILGIAIHDEDVLNRLKKTDPLAKSTQSLSLKDCIGMKSIHTTDFSKMVGLEELYIELCNDLIELVVHQDETGITQLQVLTLWKLPSLEAILVKPVVSHHFTKIRELTIHECQKLKHISWIISLNWLEKIVVSRCHGMEQILMEFPEGTQTCAKPNMTNVTSEEGETQEEDNIEFPKLRSIVLTELDKLVSICNARDFHRLESIRVQECPNLKKMPIARDYNIAKLQQICGSTEWWKGLDWDDEETREALEDFFIPYATNGSY